MTIEADEPAKSTRTYKWKMWIEILVTSVIIAVIWGLLSLPSVFYFLPQSDENVPRQPVRFLAKLYVKHHIVCIYTFNLTKVKRDDQQRRKRRI